MADKKEKKYVSDNAQLMSEWDWELNNSIGYDPTTLTLGMAKKAWWKCDKGHQWQAAIDSRNKGHGCPFCSGRVAVPGVNDLLTITPVLGKEWNYQKNGSLTPETITATSNRTVWWICNKGHEWQARVSSRQEGSGCPYCSGRYAVKGENDLQTVNPTLSMEWNYEKNENLTPADILPNSNKKVWWRCTVGHEWQSTVNHRTHGAGCPYCAGQHAIAGQNDLQTINPKLAIEWHQVKNGDLTPADILPNSNKKVWWKCAKGHEWQATVRDRNARRGCPICNSERHTSFPEYAIIYYLKKCGLEHIHSYRGNGYELDIFIPTHKIAIEYDGYYWHKNKAKQDLEKNKKCLHDGIKLYRIREGLLPLNSSSKDYIIQKDQSDLSQIIQSLFAEIIGLSLDVDLERDAIDIENLREYTEKKESLLFVNPIVAAEWNYIKNGNLKPENFLAQSSKKVWWICAKGHEWQATIASRSSGNGCPYCSGRYVLKGTNDLQTINPSLAKEWNYKRNQELSPTDVSINSHMSVWWVCSLGHEWQAIIKNRGKGNGCPYCSGRKVLKGFNDLPTINPTLAKEWNYEKNIGLLPESFTASSNKKVWWRCSHGHEWQTTINHRNRGQGCPQCRTKKN